MSGNTVLCQKKDPLSDNEYTYEDICVIQKFLQGITDIKPKIGVVCGTGLGSLAELVSNAVTIAYKDIPNYPESTVPGHAGNLIFGYISDVPVVCMQGRFHFYEGYSLSTCVMPVRLMSLLGVTYLIASNAAGGLNQSYKAGDIMLLKDHFNIMGIAGNNPLRGFNDARWGGRFCSMVNAYDSDLLKAATNIAEEMGISEKVYEGIYSCSGGPTYETIAECRAFRSFGVDAFGMSTVHEVTAARQCDIKCFAFSLITNICSLDYDNPELICEEDVLKSGKESGGVLKHFVKRIIEYIKELKN